MTTIVTEPQTIAPVPVAEELTEQVETVADANVEIATIEADRDIQIAEIQADVAETAIEASLSEQHNISEIEQCRSNIATLETKLETLATELRTELQSILTTLTPVEPLPSNPPNENVDGLSEAEIVEPGPQEPSREIPRKRKQLRWI